MNHDMTGTFLYFVGVLLFSVSGTVVSAIIVRSKQRGLRRLRDNLPSDQFATVRTEMTLHVVVWMVRTVQVALSAILALLIEADIIDPASPLLTRIVFIFFGVFYMVEPFAWLILGIVELWPPRALRRGAR